MKFEVPEKYKISDNVEKARAQCSTDVDSRLKLALIQFVGYCNEDLYNEVVKALEVLDSNNMPKLEYVVKQRKEELLFSHVQSFPGITVSPFSTLGYKP